MLLRFVENGRSTRDFSSWLETFRGTARPEDDIADYLKEEHEISRRDLTEECKAVDNALRFAVQRFWYDGHKRRRNARGVEIEETTLTRLVEHDVECYCGVIHLRRAEKASPFGYSAWWLTLDQRAYRLQGELAASLEGNSPDSPVLSADFLVNYLAFGPVRHRIAKTTEATCPC